MDDQLHKLRAADGRDRLRQGEATTDGALKDADPLDVLRSLQQQAGNAAVAGLLTKPAGAAGPGSGVQRAPQTPPTKAATGGDSFEATLFDQSILDPMRSLYAVVRDSPPDAELALQKLEPIGTALFDYYVRFRGRDDALANAFLASRGWLARTVDQLRRRVGPVKPWTDDQIAAGIQDALDDLKTIRERLP